VRTKQVIYWPNFVIGTLNYAQAFSSVRIHEKILRFKNKNLKFSKNLQF